MVEWINKAARRVPVWLIYLIGLLPVPYLVWQGATGGLGVEPIKELEHRLGELALQVFLVTLLMGPVRKHLGVNLLRFRRAFGLIGFYLVACHLLVWLVLDVQILSQIWADLLKRPYITVGMAGFLLLLPLAATSNDYSVRKLGVNWRKLHLLTYPAIILGAVHYVMLAKGVQLEPLLYLLAFLAVYGLRYLKRRPRGSVKA